MNATRSKRTPIRTMMTWIISTLSLMSSVQLTMKVTKEAKNWKNLTKVRIMRAISTTLVFEPNPKS